MEPLLSKVTVNSGLQEERVLPGNAVAVSPGKPFAYVPLSQFQNNYFTEICSGSGAGSYLRLIDFEYHSTLGLRVIQKKMKDHTHPDQSSLHHPHGRHYLTQSVFKVVLQKSIPA